MSENSIEVFTFGDPVPVMERSYLLDYLECGNMGKWWAPPMPWEALSRSYRASAHHPSALQVKVNILVSTFRPHKYLSAAQFERFALDFLLFGNAYLERRDNRLGDPLTLEAPLAKYVRRGTDLDAYYFVPVWGNEHPFRRKSIFHLLQPDPNQEIYGLPEYLAALNSAWLNESATLFRRKYYQNGSHAGFILYMTDPAQNEEDVKELRKALKESKGPGNFRNLFMYSPNGKKDGIQLIPISEVAAKDEFFNMKNVTRDDQLAAHRVPPQMMGVIPNNTGGFGQAKDAAKVFIANEIKPLQRRFRTINEWIGEEVVTFDEYNLVIEEE